MPIGKIHMLDYPIRKRGIHIEAACGRYVEEEALTRDPDVATCWNPGCREARREMLAKINKPAA
jgi:hypothetical protein